MKLAKNPCLRLTLTALCRRHAASSSTAAAPTDFDCDGGVGTRSDVKLRLTEKPSHNASLRHLNYQLRSLLGSASPASFSAALSILRGMLSPDSTSPPDAATRSIVFSGLAKRSQPLNEESLIDSYCKNQKVDAAIDLFEEMQEQDILPDVLTYTSILKCLKDHNMSDEAFELMDKMSSQRCKPNYVTLDVLTGWLTAIGETERLRLFVQRTTSSQS